MKIKDSIRKFIRFLCYKKIFNFIPDKFYLKMLYWARTGEKLNLSNPTMVKT